MLADAEDEEVLAFSMALLQDMASLRDDRHGAERRVRTERPRASSSKLRLARRLADAAAQTCSVTLLACRIPQGRSREDWVAAACDELIPAAAADSLATRSTSTSRTSRSPRGPRAGGGGSLGRRAAAPGARGPARAERAAGPAAALGARGADHP